MSHYNIGDTLLSNGLGAFIQGAERISRRNQYLIAGAEYIVQLEQTRLAPGTYSPYNKVYLPSGYVPNDPYGE